MSRIPAQTDELSVHVITYMSTLRSEVPIRWAELSTVYRYDVQG